MRATAPKGIAIAAAGALAVALWTERGAARDLPTVTRYARADRIQVAAALAGSAPVPAPVAFVANGSDVADALAAAPAASIRRGPVLLVTNGAIPPATAAELTRVKPASVVVVGGAQQVSDSVLGALRGYTRGRVSRITGRDPDASAAAVSAANFGPGVPTVYIASGRSVSDALVAAAAAARARAPLLLVGPSIPASTARELTRLRPASIAIVGGIFSVSEKLAHLLSAYTTGPVTRETGADATDTAVAVSRASYPTTSDAVYVASGVDMPDALAGAVAAGEGGGPLLLVPGGCVPPSVAREITRLRPSRILLFGAGASLAACPPAPSTG
jgi:putative cell wall-binding protein